MFALYGTYTSPNGYHMNILNYTHFHIFILMQLLKKTCKYIFKENIQINNFEKSNKTFNYNYYLLHHTQILKKQ